jgi:hypothetical protein
MKKRDRSDSLMDAVEGWEKVSDYLYVHASGARIERRGYPGTPGWYLIFPKEQDTMRRFEPTTYGCDQAFVAFAAKRAALAYLSRILKAG